MVQREIDQKKETVTTVRLKISDRDKAEFPHKVEVMNLQVGAGGCMEMDLIQPINQQMLQVDFPSLMEAKEGILGVLEAGVGTILTVVVVVVDILAVMEMMTVADSEDTPSTRAPTKITILE